MSDALLSFAAIAKAQSLNFDIVSAAKILTEVCLGGCSSRKLKRLGFCRCLDPRTMFDDWAENGQAHPVAGFGTIESWLNNTCSIPLRAHSWMNLRNRRSISLLGQTALAKQRLRIRSCQRSPIAVSFSTLILSLRVWLHLLQRLRPFSRQNSY